MNASAGRTLRRIRRRGQPEPGNSADERSRAARAIVSRASSAAECRELLAMLGLTAQAYGGHADLESGPTA